MQNHIPDLVSAHIGAYQFRPRKVRTGFSPTGIAPMAECAILLKQRSAGCD
jgi:hypothetical protein